MFRKVKDKITDEVNLATNKLQNIQIIDQLATTIGQQQFTTGNDTIPYQTLPHFNLTHQGHTSSDMPKNNQFSLVDDNPIGGNSAEDEELNSEISPQHQLFNESSIRRINNNSQSLSGASQSNNSDKDKSNNKSNGSQAAGAATAAVAVTQTNPNRPADELWQQQPHQQQGLNNVIDINQLSSDLETDVDDAKDDEIDLLSEKEVVFNTTSSPIMDAGKSAAETLLTYKTRYRNIVHLTRRLNHDLRRERDQHESQASELKKQIAALKQQLHNVKNQSSDSIASMNVPSDGSGEVTTIRQQHGGSSRQSSSKLRDMEKLMAKCKESLKAKNVQIKILKDSLGEVDKFEDHMEGMRSELRELRNAHETWTLSIAENKRVMHQEIESKNFEIDKLKTEIKDLHNQLKEGNQKSLQLKGNIQNLESRLVSTSAAHQKERESLIKELVATKNTAIKQLQRDHELQLERVKLDLERSIESVKSEALMKDEQIIRSAERQQELQEQNGSLRNKLDSLKNNLGDRERELSELKSSHDSQASELVELKKQMVSLQAQSEDVTTLKATNEVLVGKSKKLNEQLEELTSKLSSLESTNLELGERLKQTEKSAAEQEKICERCRELETQLSKEAERYEQQLFELSAKLDLMTAANTDQEQLLQEIKCERDRAIESQRLLRLEFDELTKKSENLSSVIQDNENEMQNQQEQLNQLASVKQQFDNLKRENSSLTTKLTQANSELNERNNDLSKSQHALEELKQRLNQVELESKSISRAHESLKSEKEFLSKELSSESKRRHDLDQQLVVSILAAMKNLETPDTSPGSDKNYDSTKDGDDTSCEPKSSSSSSKNLPDPVRLAEELSSLALDRSTAYVTSNQRLQAVLLDNSMINEELKRLKEELNALNKERTNEVMTSLEEVEQLRTENQALVHDQQAYDERIHSLEGEIEHLRNQIAEIPERQPTLDVSTATDDHDQEQEQQVKEAQEKEAERKRTSDLLMLKEQELTLKMQEIDKLKETLADKERQLLEQSVEQQQQQSAVEPSEEVPDPTEFKYLKNIVYQFMMGREPTTLARVISAVFKFDDEQVEQICRVQDAIHQISS